MVIITRFNQSKIIYFMNTAIIINAARAGKLWVHKTEIKHYCKQSNARLTMKISDYCCCVHNF